VLDKVQLAELAAWLTTVQRFGSLLNLNCHAHALLPDGVFVDKAFDVRPESRLGCQARLGDEDVVVEITEESLRAWLDENPEERKKARSAG